MRMVGHTNGRHPGGGLTMALEESGLRILQGAVPKSRVETLKFARSLPTRFRPNQTQPAVANEKRI